MKNKHTKCKINGCDKVGNKDKNGHFVYPKGYCLSHYRRFTIYGDPLHTERYYPALPKKVLSPSFYSHVSMKQRCLNKKAAGYERYGGRGIIICERWLGKNGFENFLSDMGERPKGTSLDRINNDDGYYKENCRWATRHEQNGNRKNNNEFVGVSFDKKKGVWSSRIMVNRERIFLGDFKEYNKAILARINAENIYLKK